MTTHLLGDPAAEPFPQRNEPAEEPSSLETKPPGCPDAPAADTLTQRTLAWLDFFELPSYPTSHRPPMVPREARNTIIRIARLVGEILAGDRPGSQLAGWFDLAARAHFNRFLMIHRGLPVRLGSVHISLLAQTQISALLRYQLAARSFSVLVGLQSQAGCWRWTSLDVLLPGPGPTGIIPRWGYDHDRA